MKNSAAKSMMGFLAISDRVIMLKLEAKAFNINVMQVYAPTQDHDGEEIETFYREIQNGIKYVKVRSSCMHNGRFECKSWE